MFIYRHLTVTIINTNLRNVYIHTLNSHNNKYKFEECLSESTVVLSM